MEALREAFRKSREETDGAADAAGRFNTALGNLGEGGAGGVNNAKDAVSELAKGLQSVKSSAKSAFAGMVTGAKSFKDALADVASSLATMFANQAFESLFGSLFPAIPGFANGTFSAPGGLAMVGERGPELVNLPRGAQVSTAQQTKGMFGGGGALDVRVFVDQGGNWQGVVERISDRSSARAASAAMQVQDRKTSANLQNHLSRKG
jgi:phage-related tail protein